MSLYEAKSWFDIYFVLQTSTYISFLSTRLKHFKGSLYSWKGVINLEETHRRRGF